MVLAGFVYSLVQKWRTKPGHHQEQKADTLGAAEGAANSTKHGASSAGLGRDKTSVPSSKEQDKTIEQSEPGEDKENYAKDPYIDPVWSIRPEPPMDPYSEEAEHRKNERIFWRTYIGLSVFTLLVSIIGFGFAYEALKAGQDQASAASRQLRIMEQAQRPWIKLVAVKPVSVGIFNGFANIGTELTVKNIGSSPAEDVYAFGKGYPDVNYLQAGKIEEAACKQATDAQKLMKIIVFPGEKRLAPNGFFPVSQSTMRKFKKKLAAISAINEPVHGPIHPYVGQLPKAKQPTALSPDFKVVGCITYAIPDAKRGGETAFILTVDRRCSDNGFGKCGFPLRNIRYYKAPDLIVAKLQWGGFAK